MYQGCLVVVAAGSYLPALRPAARPPRAHEEWQERVARAHRVSMLRADSVRLTRCSASSRGSPTACWQPASEAYGQDPRAVCFGLGCVGGRERRRSPQRRRTLRPRGKRVQACWLIIPLRHGTVSQLRARSTGLASDDAYRQYRPSSLTCSVARGCPTVSTYH